jgi:hypothetical protein
VFAKYWLRFQTLPLALKFTLDSKAQLVTTQTQLTQRLIGCYPVQWFGAMTKSFI